MYKKNLIPGDIIEFNTDKQSMYNLRNNRRFNEDMIVNVIVLEELTREQVPSLFNSTLDWYKILYQNEIYITPVRVRVKVLNSK